MNGSLAAIPRPAIPPEVRDFAVSQGVGNYLEPVIAVAQQAFPNARMFVSLGQDAEDDSHRYVAIDIDTSGYGSDELLAGQRAWSAGVARVCSSQAAIHFVLGWR